MKVRVVVRHRAGVFDPAAKVVESGLQRMGHDVASVRLGKVIEFEVAGSVDEARQAAELMCRQFLVNPVLEDYAIELLEADA